MGEDSILFGKLTGRRRFRAGAVDTFRHRRPRAVPPRPIRALAVLSFALVAAAPADAEAQPTLAIESAARHPTKDPFEVTLTFSESVMGLDAGEVTVKNGTGASFSGSGTTYAVTVTPAANFEGDATVSVAAEAATANGVGNAAASASFAVDTKGPVLSSATVNRKTLFLAYGEPLGSAEPDASAFTVKAGADPSNLSDVSLASMDAVSVSGSRVTLKLASAASAGDTVTVGYAVPMSGAKIEDLLGNPAGTLTDEEVEQAPAAMTGDFELSCPAPSAAEGTTLTCTLANLGTQAEPWPVVGLLHLSTDIDRAIVRRDVTLSITGTDPDNGLWWIGQTLVGYSRFDWSGTAAAGVTRDVTVAVVGDGDYEPAERFHLGLAAVGSRSVGALLDTAFAIVIEESDVKSGDATLSALEAAAPAGELFSLGFAADKTTYVMEVDYEVTEVVVRPTPAHARAAVSVNGDAVVVGSGSKALPLAVGNTTTTVEVTAEDETVGTYEIEWTRAARPEQVEALADGFRLRCRSWVLEGMGPDCDLANTNSGSRDWPVVAVLHSSADSERALVSRDSTNADDASFVRDVRITGGNKQAGYNYGHGELFSGESRSERLVYGYEKFDWDGRGNANQERRIPIEVIDDNHRDTASETFYVTLAPSGYSGLSRLVDNKVPVVILCAPRLLTATPGDQALDLSWAAPGCDSAPTGYKVQWRSGTEAYDPSRQADVSGLSHTIPSLTNGTEYSVRVIAVRTGGDSEPSNVLTGAPDSNPASETGSPAVNSPPAFTSPAAFTVDEHRTAVGTLAAWDSDGLDVVVDCRVTGGADAALFEIRRVDRLVFLTAPDYEAPRDAASVDPPNDAGDNRYHLVVTATSGTGARAMTAEQALLVTVADVREAATLAVTGLSSDTVAENSSYSAAPVLDGTPIGDVAWTVEGVDAAAFAIVESTGVLSMAARDYEDPADASGDNDYEVTVRATDEDENTAVAEITITVTDVREVADFSVSGLSSGTVAENSVYSAVPMVEGTSIGYVDWTVEGIDSASFAFDFLTGRLTMGAQDYEDPADAGGDNDYEVTVRATDEDENTSSASITITVTDVAERSTVRIDGLSDDTIGENEPWRSPTPTVTGAIGSVSWTREGEDAGHFEIDPDSGVLTLPGQDYEAPADENDDNVYRVTVKATDSDANQALQSIAITVTDAIEASNLVIEGLADALTPENVPWTSSAPTVTGAVGSVTWSKEGTDADDFSIDARIGVLTLPSRNYEAPSDDNQDNVYDVTVTVTDADENRASVVVSVSVTDSAETSNVNIVGLADESTRENAAWTSPAPVAEGAIGTVSWDKEGADANLFGIDPSGGTLTLDRQDYESPSDADRDNVYAVTVKAVDSDGNADAQALRVTVTDEREISTVRVSGLSSDLVTENQAWTSPVPEVTGGIGSVTWSRHGEDAGDFTIDVDTGVLTLPAQDYELPRDADRDNTYLVTAIATDADDNQGEQSIEVTVTDVDDSAAQPPGTGGGTGGGGGGGSANRPPVVEEQIVAQTLAAGEVLELDISRNFYDRDQRALDYTVMSSDPDVAAVEVDRQGVLTIRGLSRGVTRVTVTAADRRDERASQTFTVQVLGPALVALIPRASDPVREGFVRVINHSGEEGEVSIEAIDDRGTSAAIVMLTIGANAVAHFNSGDLEQGNPTKGLSGGVGSGEGDWRLILDSELELEVLAYVRTADGFLTSMHDTAPKSDGVYEVATFNPGSNPNQLSRLRLINPDTEEAEVTIKGVDDAGASPGAMVEIVVPGGASVTLTSAELEAGTGVTGALGDGRGKWRLLVRSDRPIVVMSLLSSPTGHLTNLSTVPDRDWAGSPQR